ncbi:protein-L-isoaspartate O-methyltransferase family protein [Pseudoblastomonas halimionae]|uniref:Protein-L-isoaspartate O-methyltransferase n=1 Tax=Alteriqipengyuania halimionae TaxID=1926630 RepID=A0A6I4U7F5_9SPHN|nr:protein-L-isoaspartate O-methyltransferase [Alteriqipengyuania halimionae]MXP10823.1 protein-L-isoaspartate O-methyltransferase [Alteriqipengyuania halimionae]
MTDQPAARRAMIDSQLRTSGVNDPRTLAAMLQVAREDHLPEARRANAYVDRAVPLGDGRALPAPLFHGRLLQDSDIRAGEKVLIVDSGAGYLPALVEVLGADVTAIAPEDVSKRGSKGDFDVLLIDGAVERFPQQLAKRLAEGARVFTGTVTRGVTRFAMGKAHGGEVALVPLAEMGVPVLAEFAAEEEWSF